MEAYIQVPRYAKHICCAAYLWLLVVFFADIFMGLFFLHPPDVVTFLNFYFL